MNHFLGCFRKISPEFLLFFFATCKNSVLLDWFEENLPTAPNLDKFISSHQKKGSIVINYTIIFFSRKEVTLKYNCYMNSNYNNYLQIWVSKLYNLSRKVLILENIQGKGQRKLKLIFFFFLKNWSTWKCYVFYKCGGYTGYTHRWKLIENEF